MPSPRTVLITGCSKGGLGDSLARAFQRKGARVLATARNPTKIKHFADLGIETVMLDVQSQESIQNAAREVGKLTGGTLDVLVNNSGIAYMTPLADAEISRVRDMFEVNVVSTISVTQAFLPLLRKAAPGSMIVNNSSVASVMSLPMLGVYAATKAGLSAVSDALRVELQPFGVKVVELKTGSVKSRLFENQGNVASSDGAAKLPANTIYELGRDVIENTMNGQSIMQSAADPDVWADQVVADLSKTDPPAQVWRGAKASVAWFIRTFFPHTFTDGKAKQSAGLDVFEKRLQQQQQEQQQQAKL